MLHWNPLLPEDEILFNDRIGEDLVTVVLNVQNGKRRILPMALAEVSYNGRHARLRPVVGIRDVPDHSTPGNHPEDDGAFLMDFETGKTKIVLSVAETYRHLKDKNPELGELPMFFNHTCFSKDDKRFFVLARSGSLRSRYLPLRLEERPRNHRHLPRRRRAHASLPF